MHVELVAAASISWWEKIPLLFTYEMYSVSQLAACSWRGTTRRMHLVVSGTLSAKTQSPVCVEFADGGVGGDDESEARHVRVRLCISRIGRAGAMREVDVPDDNTCAIELARASMNAIECGVNVPRGINSGGIFFKLRRRCEMV